MRLLSVARRARRRGHARAAGLLVAAWLVGCGEPAPPPAPLLRVAPAVLPGGTAPPARAVVQRFDLVEGRAEWDVEAPVKRFVAEGPEIPAGSPPMLVVGAGRRERVIRLVREGHYDPASFDRVEAWVVAHGGGGLGFSVDLYRDGRVVQSLQGGGIGTLDSLVQVGVHLPPELRDAEPFDGLGLRLLGGYRRFALRDLALVSEPPAARLPDAAAPPRLVEVGGEARPGVGLLAGRPLVYRLPPRRGARLTLPWAWPAWLGPPPDGARLTLALRTAGGAARLSEHPLTTPGAWRDLTLTLPDDDTAVELRVALHTDTPRDTARLADGDPAGAHDPADARVTAAPPRAACVLGELALHAPAPAPPTVVLITSDTHRADHAGYAPGAVELATPVLDALAARGTAYLDAWTSVNNTNPSHVALLTGTSPRDTRVLSNYEGVGPAAVTLAEVFADAGWATLAALSTRHLGPPGSGLGQGFDRVGWPVDSPQRASPDTLAQLLPWLDDFAGRPLFVWLHVFDAHTPYTPSPEAAARHWDPARDAFDPALPDDDVPDRALPPELSGLRDLEWGRAMYRAEVEQQDARLAALLDHPRLADAHVAFVADHGELLGENGVWFNHIGAYPRTLHVPLVLAGPGVARGAVVRAPVSHLDLGRTLLDLAGLDAAGFPGRALPGPDAPARAEPRFALEAFGASATVQQGDLFLVLSLADRDLANVLRSHPAHAVELYDLSVDPDAEHDLVEQRFADAARLRALLLEWLARQRPLDWLEADTAGAAQRAELEALGYVAPEGGAPAADALWQPDDCDRCRRFEPR